MKQKFFLVFLSFIAFYAARAQHQLTKLWSTDTIVPVPESVLFDGHNKVLYVSLIDGDPGKKDNQGGVAKIGLDGKIINMNWITGLSAPKGMGIFKNTLYVADIDQVVAADLTTGKITQKISVDGAQFLNDITISNDGTVFVSDSRKGNVIAIKDGKVSEYATDFKGPNGLLAVGSDLYVLASGTLYKLDASKQRTTIAEGMEASTDGIEEVKPGEFIVSAWVGVVYHVANGKAEVMLDTRNEKSNTADIGYDSKNKIVYVPTFFKKSVVAYQYK